MSLPLQNARYEWLDDYPVLRVEVMGRTATLVPETKPAIHAAGLVFLGGEFAELVPPITLRPPDGGPTVLRGFAADPRLFRLHDAFGRACGDGSFRAGPVPIPD